MATYPITRDLVNGAYNINNPERVDGEGNQIQLTSEIVDEVTLPNNCKLICSGASGDIEFEVTLTSEQETTMNNIITAHKNNT